MHRPSVRLLALGTATLGVLAGVAVALPAGAGSTPPAFTGKAGAVAAAHSPGAARMSDLGEFAKPADVASLLKQPDGATFRAVLTDVSVGAAFEKDGFSIGKDAQGWWRYASGRDAQGRMRLTSVRADLGHPAGLVRGVARQPPKSDDRSAARKASLQQQLRVASAKAAAQVAEGGKRTFKFPVLMLATWWDAEHGQTSPSFQDGTDNPEYFKKLLDGFGGNPNGTVTEFYYESSFGQFLVQVDVYGPFISSRSVEDRCYYGGIGQTDDDGDLDLLDTNLGVGGAARSAWPSRLCRRPTPR